MISQEDVLILGEVECPELTIGGYGDLALRLALEEDEYRFEAQKDGAMAQGCAYSFESDAGVIGMLPSTSCIRDDNVLTKSMLVPVTVMRCYPGDVTRMVVGVFVKKTCHGAWLAIAGYLPVAKLPRWIARETIQPFGNTPGSLAIVPSVCLEPWSKLVQLRSAQMLCL